MRYVIVGASAAGISAAESIRAVRPEADVTLVDREDRGAYARPLLSYWLAGEVTEEGVALQTDALDDLSFRRGRRATSIDPSGTLHLDDGSSLPWDRLLLATGADSKPLGVAGEEAPGVFGLRSWEDAAAIDRAIRDGAKKGLVLGGGLVGVKAALALARRGVETNVCIGSPYALSQNVGPEAGKLALAALAAQSVRVLTGHLPAAIESSSTTVTGVRFSTPDLLIPCDLVVRGKGVNPCADLLAGGNGGSNGIPVDENMATAVPNVWAAGDVARCRDRVQGAPAVNAIWPVAVEQGRVAGLNMAGESECYEGSFARNSVRIGDWHFITAGARAIDAEGVEIRTRRSTDSLRQLVLRDGVIIGFVSAEKGQSRPVNAGLGVNAVALGRKLDELGFDPLSPESHAGLTLFGPLVKER